jgi:hypothetical protein
MLDRLRGLPSLISNRRFGKLVSGTEPSAGPRPNPPVDFGNWESATSTAPRLAREPRPAPGNFKFNADRDRPATPGPGPAACQWHWQGTKINLRVRRGPRPWHQGALAGPGHKRKLPKAKVG